MDITRAYAKRAFTYNGMNVEQGQVFELIGARNDEKLIRTRTAMAVEKHSLVLDCTCGLSFVGDGAKRVHEIGPTHPKTPIVTTSEKRLPGRPRGN